MDASLSSTEKFLYDLPRFALVGQDAYKPGLERMHTILAKMGHPDRAFKSIHVAGTNGKGSTSSFIASIAAAAGRKTGLHTSPHLRHVVERMRIDGVPAPEAWLDENVSRFEDVFREAEASFFEATTALSFLFFAEGDVDLAVIEVGLGGRFDATNVLLPDLSVVTGVGLDHQDILGDSLEKIAFEKAGIFKPSIPALTGADQTDVLEVLECAAKEARTTLHVLHREVIMASISESRAQTLSIRTPIDTYQDMPLGLTGAHQQKNAALAVRAVELCPQLVGANADQIRDGLAQVRERTGIRGRGETILRRPLVVVDVAHNAEGMIAAMEALLAQTGHIDRVFLGLMKDKHLAPFDAWLSSHGMAVTTLSLDSERAVNADDLARQLRKANVDVVQTAMIVEDALKQFTQNAPDNAVGIFLGSHLVAAAAMQCIGDQC